MEFRHTILDRNRGLLSKVNAEGDTTLLDRRMYSLLLSRQARRPTPEDWWIQAAREAARWASKKEWVAITGGGLMHLDFARWAAHSFGPAVWLDTSNAKSVKPTGAGPASETWCDLRLIPDMSDNPNHRDLLHMRDEAVASLSDALIAVAVRCGGHMERVGLEALAQGRSVYALKPPSKSKAFKGNEVLLQNGAEELDLEIRIPKPESAQSVELLSDQNNIKRDYNINASDYLWHFTRECPGPWPGETWGTYFAALSSGAPESAHGALDSLKRILSEERIRACGKMIRGGYPVVCWTGAVPEELSQNIKYRRALVRWEFQPYAIGIRRGIAAKLGLKPVVMGPSEKYSELPIEDRYCYQSPPKNAAWTEAEEWRNLGDFQLTDLHPSEGAVLVQSAEERDTVLPVSRFPVINL